MKLLNTYHTDLSVALNFEQRVASASLRRGMAHVGIKICRGALVDLCSYLSIDTEAAERVVKTSPQIAALLRDGKLTLVAADDAAPTAAEAEAELIPPPAAEPTTPDTYGFGQWSYRRIYKYLRDLEVMIPHNAPKAVLVEIAKVTAMEHPPH